MEKTMEASRFVAQHVKNKDKFESVSKADLNGNEAKEQNFLSALMKLITSKAETIN